LFQRFIGFVRLLIFDGEWCTFNIILFKETLGLHKKNS
jgi:hypothetical protein